MGDGHENKDPLVDAWEKIDALQRRNDRLQARVEALRDANRGLVFTIRKYIEIINAALITVDEHAQRPQ